MEATHTTTSYGSLLSNYEFGWEQLSFLHRVGNIEGAQWELQITSVVKQMEELLVVVLPILKEYNAGFTLPQNPGMLSHVNSGRYGVHRIGKVITIYIKNQSVATALAARLVDATRNFSGPKVLTSVHLGGSVYAAHYQEAPQEVGVSYQLPKGMEWPFGNLASPHQPKPTNKINNTYVILENLKDDPKGQVLKCLRRKHLLDFKTVIIKGGNRGMCADEAGHDIVDRLKWQQTNWQLLKGKIYTPEIYEYFEIDGTGYLAMEFIKGESVSALVRNIYSEHTWPSMPLPLCLQLVDTLAEIVTIIKKVHEAGLVHRDLTTMNFIASKKGLCLLDFELAYSVAQQWPLPPFGIGSYGYMSPEQVASAVPTFKEDIYALGAIMQKLFSGLDPYRVVGTDQETRFQQQLFFVRDEKMARLIAACLHEDPMQRPTIDTIEPVVKAYRNRLATGRERMPYKQASAVDFDALLQRTLNGLSIGYQSSEGYWYSRDLGQGVLLPNEEGNFLVYAGMSWGISGILYTLARAWQAGYSLEANADAMERHQMLLAETFFPQAATAPADLGSGMAGVAIGLQELDLRGFLPEGWLLDAALENCFITMGPLLDIERGQAGLLLAVTFAVQKAPELQPVLQHILQSILQQQQPNGNWLMPVPDAKPVELPGLLNGSAGIVYALLTYLENHQDGRALQATQKALHYFQQEFKIEKGQPVKHKAMPPELSFGRSGIAVLFLKAFQVLKATPYADLARGMLNSIVRDLPRNNLTISYGITGIGEAYIEAYRVLGETIWLDKARDIAHTLYHMEQVHQLGHHYWVMDAARGATADLMLGNAGVMHFLLRYRHPEKFGFPLLTL